MGMKKRKEKLDREKKKASDARKVKTFIFRVIVYSMAAFWVVMAITNMFFPDLNKNDQPKTYTAQCATGEIQKFNASDLIVCNGPNPLHNADPKIEMNIGNVLENITLS